MENYQFKNKVKVFRKWNGFEWLVSLQYQEGPNIYRSGVFSSWNFLSLRALLETAIKQLSIMVYKTNSETWTREEIQERIRLLSRKYYPGYVETNPDAAIYKFRKALKQLNQSGRDTIEIMR